MPALHPVSAGPSPMALAAAHHARRDELWADCRNGLGIARLLVQEARPEPLVATACRLAVESACRAALEQAGVGFDGDLERALRALRVEPPAELAEALSLAEEALVRARLRLAAAERTVGRVAALLRQADPSRSWGY